MKGAAMRVDEKVVCETAVQSEIGALLTAPHLFLLWSDR